MSAPAYERMCAAIDAMRADMRAIDALPLDAVLRIARNTGPELQACEVRLRAERCHAALLRNLAGLPPKSKAEARLLADMGIRP